MHKGRLEAFTDAVIAIIMTIMVLELKAPSLPNLAALCGLWQEFSSYALSFVFLGIYWNNHHHLFQAAHKVNGAVLWGNLHLLFWLSLIPLATEWMGKSNFSGTPVAVYGGILLLCGVAYYIMAQTLARANGQDSAVATALGRDRKGLISVVIYAIGIAVACVVPVIACALYVGVAMMWLVPDRRFEPTQT